MEEISIKSIALANGDLYESVVFMLINRFGSIGYIYQYIIKRGSNLWERKLRLT